MIHFLSCWGFYYYHLRYFAAIRVHQYRKAALTAICVYSAIIKLINIQNFLMFGLRNDPQTVRIWSFYHKSAVNNVKGYI